MGNDTELGKRAYMKFAALADGTHDPALKTWDQLDRYTQASWDDNAMWAILGIAEGQRQRPEIMERLIVLVKMFIESDHAEEGSIRLMVRARELIWVMNPEATDAQILELFNYYVEREKCPSPTATTATSLSAASASI